MSQKSISFHLNPPPSGFLFQLSGALLYTPLDLSCHISIPITIWWWLKSQGKQQITELMCWNTDSAVTLTNAEIDPSCWCWSWSSDLNRG